MSVIAYPRYLAQLPLHCDNAGEDCYIVQILSLAMQQAPAPPPSPFGNDTYALAFRTFNGQFFVDSLDHFTLKTDP